MRLILAAVCIASGLAFLVPLTAQNPTPVATTSPKKRAPAPKVGLDDLKLHVKKEAEGSFAPGDAANFIKTRGGVAFVCTAEIRDELRKMGATDSALGLSECPYPWSAPQTPPAASPAAAGPVAVNCVPDDCEIAVLSMPLLRAEKGVKTITGLPPGKTTLEFRREGFQSSSQIVTLKERESSVSAALKPLESTQRQWATASECF